MADSPGNTKDRPAGRKLHISIYYLLAAIIVFVVIPLGLGLCYDVKYDDWVEAPAGYIRNDRFVVGRYLKCSGSAGVCSGHLRVVDMKSYDHREKTVFSLYGDRPCYIRSYTFLNSSQIRVTIAEGQKDLNTYDVDLVHGKSIKLELDYPPEGPGEAVRR